MSVAVSVPNYELSPVSTGYKSFVRTIGPLMCDLYALTMTQALWTLGQAETKYSVSNVFCRSLTSNGQTDNDGKPVKVPYLVNAGLGLVGEWLDGWTYSPDDLHYLATIRLPGTARGDQGSRVFSNEFLFWLSKQRITLDIDAMPEGELIFPQEPALRLSGLFWQQQVVEGAILHLVGSSTNLTTVASQVRLFAQRGADTAGSALIDISLKDEPAVERAGLSDMSLRRNPSIGGLQSARATYTAGWDSTSNVYAAKCYDMPAMGTFAHAWVMLHDTEEEAFENWAKTNPRTTVFLVDTYSTLEGVRTAIKICQKYELDLKGIRLDSGDTAYLSREATKLLRGAGYEDTRIYATNQIDRPTARALFQDAKQEVTKSSFITNFGIGSEVAINLYQPLMDEVMKLAALYGDNQVDLSKAILKDVVKLSETNAKTTLPGAIDVIRYLERTESGETRFAGDTIVPLSLELGAKRLSREIISVDVVTGNTKTPFPVGTPFYRPLKPWMRAGVMVQESYRNQNAPAILREARAQHAASMDRLDPSHLRFDKPHHYGFGIEQGLLNKHDVLVDNIRLEAKRRAQKKRFAIPSLTAA